MRKGFEKKKIRKRFELIKESSLVERTEITQPMISQMNSHHKGPKR